MMGRMEGEVWSGFLVEQDDQDYSEGSRRASVPRSRDHRESYYQVNRTDHPHKI